MKKKDWLRDVYMEIKIFDKNLDRKLEKWVIDSGKKFESFYKTLKRRHS